MKFVEIIAMILLCHFYSVSSERFLDRIRRNSADELCRNLVGGNDNETEELRSNCLRQRVLSRTARSVSILQQEDPDALRKRLFEKGRNAGDLPACPVMTNAYLEAHKRNDGMRSLSPYKSVLDCKAGRTPFCINHQVCLCNFCIDPNSNPREERVGLASRPISTTIPVIYTDEQGIERPAYETVLTGCTCVFPTT